MDEDRRRRSGRDGPQMDEKRSADGPREYVCDGPSRPPDLRSTPAQPPSDASWALWRSLQTHARPRPGFPTCPHPPLHPAPNTSPPSPPLSGVAPRKRRVEGAGQGSAGLPVVPGQPWAPRRAPGPGRPGDEAAASVGAEGRPALGPEAHAHSPPPAPPQTPSPAGADPAGAGRRRTGAKGENEHPALTGALHR